MIVKDNVWLVVGFWPGIGEMIWREEISNSAEEAERIFNVYADAVASDGDERPVFVRTIHVPSHVGVF